MREYIRTEHGVTFGICRGHQVCGIAQGGSLIQDIELDTGKKHPIGTEMHWIKIDPNSLLSRVTGKQEVLVNSLHHQALILPKDSPLQVTATTVGSEPALIEATEFKSGLGMTFQFHPEYLETQFGQEIMTLMVKKSAERKNAPAQPLHPAQDCARSISRVLSILKR